MIVGPAPLQNVQRFEHGMRPIQTELSVSLAELVERLVSHRRREDLVEEQQRLVEALQTQAFLGKGEAVAERVGNFQLASQGTIPLVRVDA